MEDDVITLSHIEARQISVHIAVNVEQQVGRLEGAIVIVAEGQACGRIATFVQVLGEEPTLSFVRLVHVQHKFFVNVTAFVAKTKRSFNI